MLRIHVHGEAEFAGGARHRMAKQARCLAIQQCAISPFLAHRFYRNNMTFVLNQSGPNNQI
jgi:hypothetical protein